MIMLWEYDEAYIPSLKFPYQILHPDNKIPIKSLGLSGYCIQSFIKQIGLNPSFSDINVDDIDSGTILEYLQRGIPTYPSEYVPCYAEILEKSFKYGLISTEVKLGTDIHEFCMNSDEINLVRFNCIDYIEEIPYRIQQIEKREGDNQNLITTLKEIFCRRYKYE